MLSNKGADVPILISEESAKNHQSTEINNNFTTSS